MKICVISPFVKFIPREGQSARPAASRRTAAKKEQILFFIKKHCCNYDFIVLPGYSDNHPTAKEIHDVLKLKISKATVFVEAGVFENKTNSNKIFKFKIKTKSDKKSYLVSAKSNFISMPEQVFIKQPTKKNIKNLQKIWEKRKQYVCNKNVLFVMCGEIDAFEINGEMRHQGFLPYDSTDLIINSTHTVRGYWQHLGAKLCNLSCNKKTVIHTANNDYNHFSNTTLSTDIRVFFDGKKINIQCNRDFENYRITWAAFEIKNSHLLEIDTQHKPTKNSLSCEELCTKRKKSENSLCYCFYEKKQEAKTPK